MFEEVSYTWLVRNEMLKVDSASCIIEGVLPCVIHTFFPLRCNNCVKIEKSPFLVDIFGFAHFVQIENGKC